LSAEFTEKYLFPLSMWRLKNIIESRVRNGPSFFADYDRKSLFLEEMSMCSFAGA
jgi:hypothetical protein